MNPSSKESIRARVLLKRRELSAKARLEKSVSISKRLQSSKLFQNAQYIHLYLSNPDEVKTGLLIQEAFRLKKQVAVPVVNKKKELFFSALDSHDLQALESGPFGIPQPKAERRKRILPDKIDLWIIPGVSFDIMGGRLGYGSGYYDRALVQTRASIIALAFEIQLVEALPLDQNDIPVDYIFTETNTIHCEESRRGSEHH